MQAECKAQHQYELLQCGPLHCSHSSEAQRRHSHDSGDLCNFLTDRQQWLLLPVASSMPLRAGDRQRAHARQLGYGTGCPTQYVGCRCQACLPAFAGLPLSSQAADRCRTWRRQDLLT